MIVYRSSFEQPLFYSLPLTYLIIEALQYDWQILYQKYTAENRYQQFFVDDNGKYGNDTTDSQAACVSHEYLCRIGVVP